MKILKRVGIGLGVFVAAFVLIGLVLPRKFHVERTVAIQAPPGAIYPTVARLKDWPTWTAWTVERYPDMKVTFSGPEEGVGAKQSWEGKSSGKGQIEIKTASPTEGISYAFAFDDMPSTGGIRFTPGPGSTAVTWYADGDMGLNPIGRYFVLLMDGMMGPDFQTGLNNLKKKVEATNPSSATEPQPEST